MVYRVKSFPSVNKENEHLLFARKFAVVALIDVHDVISHDPATEKKLLGWVDETEERRSEQMVNNCCNQTVVGVVDRNRPDVSEKEGRFFG